ncbi:MAG: NADH-quinone oxidoreductase subunit J [Bdellovibrio sp.]
MTPDVFLFWFLAFTTVAASLGVILSANPIYSVLSLVMTMVGVAAIFVSLGAYFLAGVQLIVYAGAVMVLFVMVLMLFDLKNEIHAFTRGPITGALKIAAVGLLGGMIIGAIALSATALMRAENKGIQTLIEGDNTKALGKLLFSQYLFGFEALGVLLLIVAVGAVALARSKGGTHAKH